MAAIVPGAYAGRGLIVMATLSLRGAIGALLIAGALAACGDTEVDQRKAFIHFLQTYIVDKPGAHVPRPTDDDIKSFGPYAAHYAVIVNFTSNPEMMGIGAKMTQVTQKASIQSIDDLVAHRAEIKSVSTDLAALREAMNREFAKASAARDALKQPDDLKAVFDKAFDKDVVAPVKAFNEAIPLAVDIAAISVKLGDYIEAHRDRVVVSGTSIAGKDEQTSKELGEFRKMLSADGARFQQAQQRLHDALQGS